MTDCIECLHPCFIHCSLGGDTIRNVMQALATVRRHKSWLLPQSNDILFVVSRFWSGIFSPSFTKLIYIYKPTVFVVIHVQ